MKQVGTHLVVDAWDAPEDLLNDPEGIRRAIIDAIEAGEATLIDLCVHQFSPHGVTATATLAESHIAIDILLPICSFAVAVSPKKQWNFYRQPCKPSR